ILKAGGAYVPIDPVYPDNRVKYILDDSNVKILLTGRALEKRIPRDIDSLYIDELEEMGKGKTEHAENHPEPEIAYIIYTSGSTGRPKGVLIRHNGFINLVYSHRKAFGEEHGDRMSQVASPGFDAMAFEVWPCLLSGAALYVADDHIRVSPTLLMQWLIDNSITITFQSTIMGQQLLKEKWPQTGVALRALRVAGEQLRSYPGRTYPFRFYNLYGPTEDTVWTTFTEVPMEKEAGQLRYPSIGKPIENHRVYITGTHLGIQPVGIIGELCIAGDGLAAGYLNRPELTAEKFVPNPFSDEHPPENGNKNRSQDKKSSASPLPLNAYLYKTGDLARWLPDGSIEFIGRCDYQVKIRGFRIELGEIEKRMLEMEFINEAIVLDRTDNNGEKYLCAYIVMKETAAAKAADAASPEQLERTRVRRYLQETLPDYMIPSFFVPLDSIPLTPGGKTDRKKLPEPEIEKGNSFSTPADYVEEKLVALWAEVLTIKKELISVEANFFELGGHSLKAVSVIARIHKEFDVKVPLAQMFENPTIRDTGSYIHEAARNVFTAVKPVEKKEYYPMASVQKRMYLMQQIEPESIAYNMPEFIELSVEPEIEQIEHTFTQLIKRHENFRTSFPVIAGETVQRIHENLQFKIETYDTAEDTAGKISESFVRPFDLARAPLLRIGLLKTEENRGFLLIDVHHIIYDGISRTILQEEFNTIYNGEEQTLQPLTLQYKDYSQWQNSHRYTSGGAMRRQENYWLERFEGGIPKLELPYDFDKNKALRFDGSSETFEMTGDEKTELNKLATQQGTTMYVLILAIYEILLAKLGAGEDVVVGTPVAGRPHADLEKIIGMLVNTLPLRNYPKAGLTFSEYLQQVKTGTIGAFENQEYPFEDLVEKLLPERDITGNPIFDVMFSYQTIEKTAAETPGKEERAKKTPGSTTQEKEQHPEKQNYAYERKSAQFDLTLSCLESDENLRFELEYGTQLFKKETILNICGYFKEIKKQIVENNDMKIEDIKISHDFYDEKLVVPETEFGF
ncbi:MAG: amino acid adenylation domain-containing protein, partial [bacterium]|nr:amino acid adenylation domain-containing protein [bacterium]